MALTRVYQNTGAVISLGTARLRHITLTDGGDMPSVPFFVRYQPGDIVKLVDHLPWHDQPVASSILIEEAPEFVGRTMESRWVVRGPAGRTMQSTWNVLGPVGRTMSSEWNVETAPAESEGWPMLTHLPGSTRLIDQPFQSIDLGIEPIGKPWAYATGWFDGNPAIVMDASAPHSPHFLRYTYPEGFEGGTSPGRAVQWDWGNGYRDIYYGIWVRYSNPWHSHPSGYDKLFYWGEKSAADLGHATSQYMLHAGTNGVLQITLQYAQPGGGQRRSPWDAPNVEQYVNETPVSDGDWHRVEMICNRNTGGLSNGRVRVWVDSLLQFQFSDVRWAPGDARFVGFNNDPVWGGIGAEKDQTDTYDQSHLVCYGIPA